MADEKSGKGDRLGPFELGRDCDEVGPDLGHLREARNTETGRNAIVLSPGPHVDWLIRGSWRVSVSGNENPPCVSLEVERAPVMGRMPKLADILVLISTAVQRVEDNARVEAHLLKSREGAPRFGWTGVLAVVSVLVLGLGLWLRCVDRAREQGSASARLSSQPASPAESPQTVDLARPEESSFAFPMPDKPFRNQATAPCYPKQDEVEIRGGCWVALDRRPPCLEETQAEHQGKCYLPVGKRVLPARVIQP